MKGRRYYSGTSLISNTALLGPFPGTFLGYLREREEPLDEGLGLRAALAKRDPPRAAYYWLLVEDDLAAG